MTQQAQALDPERIRAAKREATQRLDEARGAAASAVLAGSKYDVAAAARVEQELSVLDDAERQLERQAREAEVAKARTRRRELQQAAADVAERYFEAVERAERGARELASGVRDVRSASASLSGIAQALGRPLLIEGCAGRIEARLSERIAAVLRLVIGHPHRFGVMQFHGGQRRDPDAGWPDAERQEMAPSLQSLATERTEP